MRAGKPDGNQAEIVKALRAVGCSVVITTACGSGFPDLVVGHKGLTYLMEVKTPTGELLPNQVAFASAWKGHYTVVRSVQEALSAVGLPPPST